MLSFELAQSWLYMYLVQKYYTKILQPKKYLSSNGFKPFSSNITNHKKSVNIIMKNLQFQVP